MTIDREADRKEVLRRLRDPRPPLYWGQFYDLAALTAGSVNWVAEPQAGDTATAGSVTYVFVSVEVGWAPLGYNTNAPSAE